MTYIYNPQQLESSENTYVTALAFTSGTGVLTATRNDGVELTVDLDGRYATENTHLNSASFNNANGEISLEMVNPSSTIKVDIDGRYPTQNTHLNTATLTDNILSLGMVNPSSTITVDLTGLSDLNTHLDSATFDAGTKKLTLNMVNPSSQIIVDLNGIEGSNTYVDEAEFSTSTGKLTLTRNDDGKIEVELDGRYATQNTYLNSAIFNSTTRELTLGMVNPTNDIKVIIPGGPDENTFLSSLAFNDNSGDLNATLNTGAIITANLDGRYNLISNNTHLDSASFNSSTGIISLEMVNPTSTITVDISGTAGVNTHLDSAGLDGQTLELNMVNPESQITVNLGTLVNGKYLPITFDDVFSGNLNDLLSPGVYKVSSTALNAPLNVQGIYNMVSVFSDKNANDETKACTQIWTTATNQSDGNNPNNKMWLRVYSEDTIPIVSQWQEINVGMGNGYLRGPLISPGRDLNHPKYRETGKYYITDINSLSTPWTNGPANFPDSNYNVLNVSNLSNSAVNVSYGFGYQELVTADYHIPDNHVRVFRRNFEASSTVENYSPWFEVFHQGVPINTEVLDIYTVPDTRSVIDVSNVRVIELGLGLSYGISTLQNGVEGQVVTFIKTNINGMVSVNWTGNIHPPTGGTSSFNMRYYRGGSFINRRGEWYPFFSNSTS